MPRYISFRYYVIKCFPTSADSRVKGVTNKNEKAEKSTLIYRFRIPANVFFPNSVHHYWRVQSKNENCRENRDVYLAVTENDFYTFIYYATISVFRFVGCSIRFSYFFSYILRSSALIRRTNRSSSFHAILFL